LRRDGVPPHFVRDSVPGCHPEARFPFCHPEARKRRGTPRFARGDKEGGSGRQQEGLHKNIFNTAPEGIKALGKASG